MPRPCCCCRIGSRPETNCFKPAGVPMRQLQSVVLQLDEWEAVRLADAEGLYQEAAALQMGISRPTFSRILNRARRKIALALIEGQALHIANAPAANATFQHKEETVS